MDLFLAETARSLKRVNRRLTLKKVRPRLPAWCKKTRSRRRNRQTAEGREMKFKLLGAMVGVAAWTVAVGCLVAVKSQEVDWGRTFFAWLVGAVATVILVWIHRAVDKVSRFVPLVAVAATLVFAPWREHGRREYAPIVAPPGPAALVDFYLLAAWWLGIAALTIAWRYARKPPPEPPVK